MEKATTNSLRREAEELGLRAGRKVDVIDSIDGEENERWRKRSGVVVRLFSISFNATWADTRNASDTTPYCGQKWERRCVCVDFEKLVLIYIILFTMLATGFAAALLENAKLTRENERLKKILYRRGYK